MGNETTPLTNFQQDVIKKLIEKKLKNCPMCGHDKFGVLDGFFIQAIFKDRNKTNVISQSVPMIVFSCHNCGFVSQHVAASLGLFPEGKERS